jgi:hypothetical protein
LGCDEDQEEALEPLSEMLLSSIVHVHFVEAPRHASVYKGDTGERPDSLRTKTCSMCNTPIGTVGDRKLDTGKGFICPTDECTTSKPNLDRPIPNGSDFGNTKFRAVIYYVQTLIKDLEPMRYHIPSKNSSNCGDPPKLNRAMGPHFLVAPQGAFFDFTLRLDQPPRRHYHTTSLNSNGYTTAMHY